MIFSKKPLIAVIYTGCRGWGGVPEDFLGGCVTLEKLTHEFPPAWGGATFDFGVWAV